MVRSGQFDRIIEKKQASKAPIDTLVEPAEAHRLDEEMVTRVFKVRYADLEPIRGVLSTLVTPGADLVSFPPDTLILTELATNLPRLEKLIAALDVEPASDVLKIVPVRYASAQDAADRIQRVLDKNKPANAKPGASPLVVADERTNKLIVSASPAQLERILSLLIELDVPLPGDGQVNVYALKHAEAKEVVTVLEPLLNSTHGGKPAGGGAQPAPLFTGEVKVAASEATNALVVVANPADYRSVVRLIDALDQPRKQIFIEAALLEVTAGRTTDFGLSVHDVESASTSKGALPWVVGTNLPGEPSSTSIANVLGASGLVAGLQGPLLQNLVPGLSLPKFGLLLHALQESSDVNVVSTPHVLALDNKEAVIHVGQKIPFQTGYIPQLPSQATGSGATPAVTTAVQSYAQLYAPITRENVELKLTVTPHVGDGDDVRLEIDEQAEEIDSAADKVLGPTTSTRGTKTAIVVQDHDTVVLGGIMQDRLVDGSSKIPILGDIPILGLLFRTTNRQKTKTNLLLFLTPHIIRTHEDFEAISARKTQEREKLLEELWGEKGQAAPPIDFKHKPGPLAALGRALRHETNRPENGGPGNPGERVVAPRPDSEASVPLAEAR